MSDPTCSATVVIPARNEAATIDRCLGAVSRAARSAGVTPEIVVVDNHSTDETGARAAAAGARVVQPPERVSIASLRNRGAAEAGGEILLFLDADMEVPEDWLTALLPLFADGTADALGFVEAVPAQTPWYARIWSERIQGRRGRRRPVDFLPGRNMAVRRQWFDRVGGFDVTLRTSEDKDLTLRLKAAGATVLSVPEPRPVHWGYEKTLGELIRKEFWRQGSHVAMLRRHGPRLRLLRFPLMALGHAVWPLVALGAGLSAGWVAGLALLLLWPLPALVLALRHRPPGRGVGTVAALTLLHGLRLVVAGVSVVAELVRDQGRGRLFDA